MMKLAGLTRRLGDDAANAWHVHTLACEKRDRGEHVVMLSIGEEANETTAPVVVAKAIDSLNNGRHHYSDVRGPEKLRTLIAERHACLAGQKVNADQCTVYAGAQNSLFAVAQCLLEPGDEVILPEPYYTTYPGVFTCTGATAVKVSGNSDNLYLSEIEAIVKAITEKTRAIVITQPGNPIGSFYRPEQLELLVNVCRERNIWLISDEVYSLLLSPDDRSSPAAFDPDCSCVVTINARRAVAVEHLSQAQGIRLMDSGAGMFLVLDVTDSGLNAQDFALRLLEDEAIATLPCTGFGSNCDHLLRLGLCVPTEQLAIACKQLARFTTSL